MKVKMKQAGEGKYGAPVGRYRAKFVGVEEREPMEGSDYGPGLEWSWEILAAVDGSREHAGKIVSRTTALEPTNKNSCGRFLKAVTDQIIGINAEVDLSDYVGRLYRIEVEPNSTGKNTRVAEVPQLLEGDAAATAPHRPSPPQPAATGPGPRPPAPPSPPSPPAPPQPPVPPMTREQAEAALEEEERQRKLQPAQPPAPPTRFWVMVNPAGPPQLMEEHEVQTLVTGKGLDCKALMCMSEDQSSGWKSAEEFKIVIPF
jgi:hypothetical protein